MWTDVVDLHQFYEGSTGQVARRMIRRAIRAMWPDVKGDALLGVGYATPYLRPFRGEAERVVGDARRLLGAVEWRVERNLQTCASDTFQWQKDLSDSAPHGPDP